MGVMDGIPEEERLTLIVRKHQELSELKQPLIEAGRSRTSSFKGLQQCCDIDNLFLVQKLKHSIEDDVIIPPEE